MKLIDKLTHNSNRNFFLLAGPCVIEGEEMAMQIAEPTTLVKMQGE